MTTQSGLEIERVELEMYNIENNSAQSTYTYFMEFWKYEDILYLNEWRDHCIGEKGMISSRVGKFDSY